MAEQICCYSFKGWVIASYFFEYFAILLLNTILKRHTEILLNFTFFSIEVFFFFFPFKLLACSYVLC